MMRFFSKIRYKNLTQNKAVKYLGYALGEIVLVVIGILIALEINNWDRQISTEAEIEKLFNLVEIELVENLSNFDDFNSYYDQKDSLISLVLSDHVDRDDYNENAELRGLIINSREFWIKDDAYKQLIERRRDIPEKYSLNVTNLINAYEKKIAIDNWNIEVDNFAKRTFEYYEITPPYGNGKYTDLIDYKLSSSLFKGRVRVFRSYFRQNLLRHVKEFYCNALLSLRDISNKDNNNSISCSDIHIKLQPKKEIEELEVFQCDYEELLPLGKDYSYQNILIENHRNEVVYFEYLGDNGEFKPSGKIPKCDPNEVIYASVVSEITYRVLNEEGKCLGIFIPKSKETSVVINN